MRPIGGIVNAPRPNPIGGPGRVLTPPGITNPGRQGGFIQRRNPWAGLIGGDWGVADAESRMNAAMGRARGDFTTGIRQALIDLGITDKSKLGTFGTYIDDQTIAKAAANKYSQTAQISQQVTSRRAQSEAALAARGLLSSGQLTTDTERTIAEGEAARYDALRNFLSGGQQGLTQLADLNEQYAGQLAQARFEAAARNADIYYRMLEWDQWNQQSAPTPGTAAAAAAPRPPTPAQSRQDAAGAQAYYNWKKQRGLA